MENPLLTAASRLSDTDLLRRLTDLVSEERQATAQLNAHRAELDRRKVSRSGRSSQARDDLTSAGLPRQAEFTAPPFRIDVTVTAETYDKLCRLQALLRHEIPDGDLTTVFDLALTLLDRHAGEDVP